MIGLVGANLFRANSTQHRQNKDHTSKNKPVISYDYFAKKSNLPHHQAPLTFGTAVESTVRSRLKAMLSLFGLN